jgi:hypothetical protein
MLKIFTRYAVGSVKQLTKTPHSWQRCKLDTIIIRTGQKKKRFER